MGNRNFTRNKQHHQRAMAARQDFNTRFFRSKDAGPKKTKEEMRAEIAAALANTSVQVRKIPMGESANGDKTDR